MRRQLIIIALLFITVTSTAQDSISTEILNHINMVRLGAGIAPLHFNTALQSAAQQHSNDMASVEQLSHIGTNGSQFWERVQTNAYILSAGAENILSRGDTNSDNAFMQWYNSAPHRANMLNGDYFEVGIAYTRAKSGRVYFTLILGVQANFTASTAIPTNTNIPPTALPRASNTPIPTNTIIPATATNPPAPTIIPTMSATNTAIPTRASSTPGQVIITNTPLVATATEFIQPDIQLIYDNSSFVLINVSGGVLNLANLFFESDNGTLSSYRWNTEFLSQPLSGFTNGDCLQAWTLETSYLNVLGNCRFRHAWIAVADNAVFWRNADIFTVRNGQNLVGICRVDAGVCDINLSTSIANITVNNAIISSDLPDLRLEFPDSSFSLMNVSGRSLDLRGLVFRSESGTLFIEEWDNGFLTQALDTFEDGSCLQVWTFDYSEQSAPERCRIRHAWILVDDTSDFWRQMDRFTVERNGIILGECTNDGTHCSISLNSP